MQPNRRSPAHRPIWRDSTNAQPSSPAPSTTLAAGPRSCAAPSMNHGPAWPRCSGSSTSRASRTRSPSSSARPHSTRRWRGSKVYLARRRSTSGSASRPRIDRSSSGCCGLGSRANARTWRALETRRARARFGSPPPSPASAGRSQRLRRQRSLTSQRLTALESRARAAEQRSANLTKVSTQRRCRPRRQVTPDPTATAPDTPSTTSATTPATRTPAPPPSGTRTLVVDAVAYHLPGHTASGLPVGVGVIAVDPAVIPLGTRLNIPGYGPAVAADVGSAVKGNIIDLWMPTTAQARAWGRRSVTITIYG